MGTQRVLQQTRRTTRSTPAPPFALRYPNIPEILAEEALELEELLNNRVRALRARGHLHNRAIARTMQEYDLQLKGLQAKIVTYVGLTALNERLPMEAGVVGE